MNNTADPLYNRYNDLDFSNAKPVSEIPGLKRLQTEYQDKTKITLLVDNELLAIFKARAQREGNSYQDLLTEALSQFAQGLTLADVVRETIRQELHHS